MKFLHLLGGKAHVAPLLGAVRCRDQVTLVLPYVEHQKFKDYLPSMTLSQIRDYMRALFESLQHLHRHHIIHRDVKPGNFLYNPKTNTFVLVDFGLAQAQAAQTKDLKSRESSVQVAAASPLKRKASDNTLLAGLHSPAKRQRIVASPASKLVSVKPLTKKSLRAPRGGTRGFRAPEVLLKCQNQTVAIDIWSAGVMLLCILSTRYPFFATPDDLGSLAEIAAIFGTQEVRSVALLLNRRVTFPSDPLDIPQVSLKNLCNSLTSRTEEMSDSVFDLLGRCLDLNPNTRITAEETLQHPFFQNG